MRSIPRPKGEAGRKNAKNAKNNAKNASSVSGPHREGFTLKDILNCESNVNPEHYSMIQVCPPCSISPPPEPRNKDTVHRLAAIHLDIRRTWRENQGEHLVTVCTHVCSSLLARSPSPLKLGQAAELHPCLYDYDAFWPVHDHLKRHLVSTRDKYSYLDPELVPLYDAETAARGEVRPPPRHRRHALGKSKNPPPSAPRSPSPSPTPPHDCSNDLDQRVVSTSPLPPPPQPEPPHPAHQVRPEVRPAGLERADPELGPPAHVQHPPQQQLLHPRAEIEIGIGTQPEDTSEFLMTLYRDLVLKGHPLRRVSTPYRMPGAST